MCMIHNIQAGLGQRDFVAARPTLDGVLLLASSCAYSLASLFGLGQNHTQSSCLFRAQRHTSRGCARSAPCAPRTASATYASPHPSQYRTLRSNRIAR
eukprot:3880140-Rhodomonas_salina.1